MDLKKSGTVLLIPLANASGDVLRWRSLSERLMTSLSQRQTIALPDADDTLCH